MRNAGMDDAQTGIKIAGKKINNLRYADDTTLVAVVPYKVLTVASLPTFRFFRRQVRLSGIPISLRAFHSLL